MNESVLILAPIIERLVKAVVDKYKKEEEAIEYLRSILEQEEEDRLLITVAVIKAKAEKELSEKDSQGTI